MALPAPPVEATRKESEANRREQSADKQQREQVPISTWGLVADGSLEEISANDRPDVDSGTSPKSRSLYSSAMDIGGGNSIDSSLSKASSLAGEAQAAAAANPLHAVAATGSAERKAPADVTAGIATEAAEAT